MSTRFKIINKKLDLDRLIEAHLNYLIKGVTFSLYINDTDKYVDMELDNTLKYCYGRDYVYQHTYRYVIDLCPHNENTENTDKYGEIEILKKFGIVHDKIILYSCFNDILWIYLNKLVRLGKAYIACPFFCGYYSGINNVMKIMSMEKNKIDIFFRIGHIVSDNDILLYRRGWYNTILYDLVIDDFEKIERIITFRPTIYDESICCIAHILKLYMPIIIDSGINSDKYRDANMSYHDKLSIFDLDIYDVNIKFDLDYVVHMLRHNKYYFDTEIINCNNDFHKTKDCVAILDPMMIHMDTIKYVTMWDNSMRNVNALYIHKIDMADANEKKVKISYAGCIKIRCEKDETIRGTWIKNKKNLKKINWIPVSDNTDIYNVDRDGITKKIALYGKNDKLFIKLGVHYYFIGKDNFIYPIKSLSKY